MFSIRLLIGLCVLSIASADAAFAQAEKEQTKKGAVSSESGAVRATTVFRCGKIKGMKVRNPEGEELGEVKELVIDLEDQRVRYAAISFGGFLGLGDKLFAVPMDSMTLKHGQDDTYFLLDLPKDKLKNAPGFDEDSWPEMGNPKWAADVDKYFAKGDGKPQTVKGTVVGASADTLIIKDESGKKRTYRVGPHVVVMQNGDKAKLDELQPQQSVALNIEPREGKPVVTQIEAKPEPKTTKTGATSKTAATSKTVEGEVSSVEGSKLKLKDSSGDEKSYDVSEKATVTLDGKEAKLDDLKAGQKVKVTLDDDKKASKVAASAKND